MPKRTWNPKQKKRVRKFGFRNRTKSVLKNRRAKGRVKLAHSKKR